MAILIQCPICHKRQSMKKRRQCLCGEDLQKVKKSERGGGEILGELLLCREVSKRSEVVGTSLQEARDAEGKRKAQKREGKFFDMLPQSKKTFG